MTTRIEAVEVIELRVPGADTLAHAGTDWTCLVLVRTNTGVTGVGEVTSVPAVIRAVIETPRVLVRACGLRDLLIGRDPTVIGELWASMYEMTSWYGRRGVVLHAIGALDVALWDLLGKLERRPVAELLGTLQRDTVAAYGTIFPTGGNADELRRSLDRALATGLRAFKICADPRWRDVEHAESLLNAARAHVGKEVGLILEAVWAFRSADEVMPLLDLLVAQEIAWLEAPLPLDDLDGYARLRGKKLSIAGGDNALTTHQEFAALIDAGGVDIVQPDIALAGGFTELRRIAALARERNRRLVVHGYKTALTDAANLAYAAVHWADEPIEVPLGGTELRAALTHEQPRILPDGRIERLPGPGLGITLRDDTIDRFRVG